MFMRTTKDSENVVIELIESPVTAILLISFSSIWDPKDVPARNPNHNPYLTLI